MLRTSPAPRESIPKKWRCCAAPPWSVERHRRWRPGPARGAPNPARLSDRAAGRGRRDVLSPGDATRRAVALVDGLLEQPRRAIPRAASGRSTRPATESLCDRRSVDATVLIATFNRAGLLDETLQSVRALRVSPVTHLGSHSRRQQLVRRHPSRGRAAHDRFPRSACSTCSNRGRDARARSTQGSRRPPATVIAFTDDDVRVDPGWLDAACDELSGAIASIGYVGGPVRPIWEAPPPRVAGADPRRSLGHDRDPGPRRPARSSTRRRGKVPLGANMAALRTMLDADRGVPGRPRTQQRPSDPRPGSAGTARSGSRSRVSRRVSTGDGAHHHVPARRLTRQVLPPVVVWQGRVAGGARARPVRHRTGLDLATSPACCSVPRPMYGSAIRHARRLAAGHACGPDGPPRSGTK